MSILPDAQRCSPGSLMIFAPGLLERRGLPDLLQGGSDPRVGSGRQDLSGGGTLSTAANSKTSSLSKLGATFIPVVVYFIVCLVIFVILRRRCQRVYAPRTIAGLRVPEIPAQPLPDGWLNWVAPFFKIPDTFVLTHGTLDGFFFLRFLKVVQNICLGGCVILWPVLFPIHATGGGGLSQLDLLTIGNVKEPKRLYAHVIMAWVFFGFVLYTIVRECIFYVNLRQAYLSSASHSHRISSRTMLLTGIPPEYLDERRLRKLYGDSVRRVHIPQTAKVLVKLIKERKQTATRLEKAEVELIQKANKARHRQLAKSTWASRFRHKLAEPATASTVSHQDVHTVSSDSDRSTRSRGGHLILELPGSCLQVEGLGEEPPEPLGPDTTSTKPAGPCETVKEENLDYVHPYGLDAGLPDVRGSVAALYIPAQARPHHRPLGNFGRRVDTQENAQAAQQVVAHHRPLRMSSRILGIHPDEILWKSLRMSWWEQILRRFAVLSIVTVSVIFWSIPSAAIGLVSQIDFLAKNIVFLAWIKRLPAVLLSFLQGFVPSVALSVWMAAIPFMLRVCGRQAGIPSVTLVELFVQKAYFSFQVVQVFLITTLTSAASAAFTDILQNPIKAKDILAANLPMASNFYLSYILIQCIASSGTSLLQIFSLIRHHVLSRLSTLPRAQYQAWHKLQPARWGGLFPIYSNMGVIALSYACIAPLILIFAAGGLAVMRLIWKYNLVFVLDSSMDSKGLFYPQALLHLMTGLYLAEICLIGLFALHLSFGPLALMVLFFIFTGLVHVSLADAIAPLLQNLPQTLALEEEIQQEEQASAARAQAQMTGRSNEESEGIGAASSYFDPEQAFGDDDSRYDDNEEGDGGIHVNVVEASHDRAIEGASGVKSVLVEWVKMSTKSKVRAQAESFGLPDVLSRARFWTDDKADDRPPGFLRRWLHPEKYEDFIALRKMTSPNNTCSVGYPDDHKYQDYLPPELWEPRPTLWIPRDQARVSRQEVAHTKKFTPISDRGAFLDEKCRVVVHLEEAPFTRRLIII